MFTPRRFLIKLKKTLEWGDTCSASFFEFTAVFLLSLSWSASWILSVRFDLTFFTIRSQNHFHVPFLLRVGPEPLIWDFCPCLSYFLCDSLFRHPIVPSFHPGIFWPCAGFTKHVACLSFCFASLNKFPTFSGGRDASFKFPSCFTICFNMHSDNPGTYVNPANFDLP